jgi:hypothetical protein
MPRVERAHQALQNREVAPHHLADRAHQAYQNRSQSEQTPPVTQHLKDTVFISPEARQVAETAREKGAGIQQLTHAMELGKLNPPSNFAPTSSALTQGLDIGSAPMFSESTGVSFGGKG